MAQELVHGEHALLHMHERSCEIQNSKQRDIKMSKLTKLVLLYMYKLFYCNSSLFL